MKEFFNKYINPGKNVYVKQQWEDHQPFCEEDKKILKNLALLGGMVLVFVVLFGAIAVAVS